MLDILDIENLKSTFLAIKSGKKADPPLSVLLNPSYLPPCDLCTPSNVIFLLTCAIGVSKHSLFRIFGHKILQRWIFLLWSFWIRSVSSSVSYPIDIKPYHYLPVLLETQSPHSSAFLTIKSVKKWISLFLSFWIGYISCQVSHPIHLKPFHNLWEWAIASHGRLLVPPGWLQVAPYVRVKYF